MAMTKQSSRSGASSKKSSSSSARKKSGGRKYGRKASQEVRTEMRHRKQRKHGEMSREQAAAIGLSKARRKGAKVPAKKK